MRRTKKALRGEGLGGIVLRALAGTGAIRIAAMIASFFVGVQLARGLGVSGYGYYGIALSIITLCSIPGEMGLPRLVTREVAGALVRKDMPHLFGALRWADSMAWRVSAAMSAAVLIGSVTYAFYRPSTLAWTLICGIPMISFMALARIRGGSLQGLQNIVSGLIPANLMRPLLVSVMLFIIGGVGVSISPPGAMALNSISAVAAFLVAHYLLMKRLPKERPAQLAQGNRGWFASSIPMALTDGMRILQAELSTLLLALVTVAADVGLFRIAIVTATMAATPIPIVNHVALPLIARLYAEQDGVRLQKVATKLAQAQTLGVLLVTLPLFIAAEPLIRLAFGPDFEPAATAVRIIAAAQLVNAAFGPNVALLNMTHHERRVTRAMGIALIVNVVAILVLGAIAGLPGAAAGVFIAFFLWNLLTWLDARRLLAIDTFILPIGSLVPLAPKR